LIVTGPNIASQELLFSQIAESLRSNAQRTVITLRSGDATNLKAVLKKLIRDATNQKEDEGEDAQIVQKDVSFQTFATRYSLAKNQGRKLLNYDLQILHDHVKSSTSAKIIVAFQDSEGFDSGLLAEMLVLFRYAPRVLESDESLEF
jgi:origin recognition complex subunit 3